MSTKAQEANQFAFLVIIPMIIPINLIVPIISSPDGIIAQVLSFIPFTAPVTMMIRLGADGSSILASLASLAVIVLTGVVLLWASARVVRASLLMYGQRPGLRRVLNALRGAG